MTADDLRHIDYYALPISDYSRSYILRMLPHIDYYLDIYRVCIRRLLERLHRQPAELTVVDYGGGHGFLSCLLKEMGFGQVVYIDYNPQAAATVTAVKEALGYGPDTVLQGDAATLRQWCRQHDCRPDGLLGMDVIEHIYCLETFFDDLYAIGPMPMIFTTGSTPDNPHVVRRLHQVMVTDEQGHDGKPGFYQLRRQYLADQLPQLSETELDYWAAHTRGLRYGDLVAAVEADRPYPNDDPYNTCDPATGSWTERILSRTAYRQLLQPHGATVTVANGFYNTYRRGTKALPSRILNGWLRLRLPFARHIAPFIIIEIH